MAAQVGGPGWDHDDVLRADWDFLLAPRAAVDLGGPRRAYPPHLYY